MNTSVEIIIDKRIELLGILLRLSNYGEKFPCLVSEYKNYNYLNNTIEKFKNFKDHKAIELLNEILKCEGFSYDAPICLFLQLDKNYVFNGHNSYPFVDRLKQSGAILEFLKEIKNFVDDTNFEMFYEENKAFYEKTINEFKKNSGIENVLPWIKTFFKRNLQNKNFVVNLAMLLSGGAFGCNFENTFYCIDSRSGNSEGDVIDFCSRESLWLQSRYMHEFAHSIVNPITDKYIKRIRIPYFAQETRNKQIKSAYLSLASVIDETIIRSCQLIYIKDHGGELADFLSTNDRVGFPKDVLFAVADKLDEYRNQNKNNFEKSFLDIANTISIVTNKNIKSKSNERKM